MLVMGSKPTEEFDFKCQILIKYFLKTLVFIMRSNSPLKNYFYFTIMKNFIIKIKQAIYYNKLRR